MPVSVEADPVVYPEHIIAASINSLTNDYLLLFPIIFIKILSSVIKL